MGAVLTGGSGGAWGPLVRFGGVFGVSWPLLGGSWGPLGRSWAALGTTHKNHSKSVAQNDPFRLPKESQNGTQNGPRSDQNSMQKTKRKKNRNKTKIGPLKTQKVLKNLRKNNKNQKTTSTHFDRFWTPKTSPKGTPKRSKNEQKNNTKKERKKRAKKDPKRSPQPDSAMNGKRRERSFDSTICSLYSLIRSASLSFFLFFSASLRFLACQCGGF